MLGQQSGYVNDRGDTVCTPGIDYGRPLKILHHTGPWVVVRRAGHMTWSGVGSSIYAQTEYMLLKVLNKNTVEVMKQIEPGLKWRTALKELIADADSRSHIKKGKN